MNKMVSSWIRKVLSVVVTHVPKHSPGCGSICSMVAGVFLMSTLPAVDCARVSTPAGHYFQHISLLQIVTSRGP